MKVLEVGPINFLFLEINYFVGFMHVEIRTLAKEQFVAYFEIVAQSWQTAPIFGGIDVRPLEHFGCQVGGLCEQDRMVDHTPFWFGGCHWRCHGQTDSKVLIEVGFVLRIVVA